MPLTMGPVVVATPSIGVLGHVAQDTAPVASKMPQGFPPRLDSELAWIGQDFVDSQQYVYNLTEADLVEVKLAVVYFKTLELDGEYVSRDNFPLPSLGAKLDSLSREVHSGRGFCLVRGINPQEFSVEDLTLVYLGVQSYIADQRARQDNRGNMLVHIIADTTSKTSTEHHRHSNKSITFHTEETGDVVGWLTRSTASSGGKCVIASAYTVYNALASTRPDLLRLLTRSDWPFAFPRFHCRPIFMQSESESGSSHVVCNFGRTPLLGNAIHPRPAHLPTVSAKQIEALDAVEAIARATELEISTQAGDMHFINNLAILHRRESFQDGAAPVEKRHLVRMRLRSTERGWTLPSELSAAWDVDFDEDSRRVWHIEPMPEAFFPLRKYPN